MTRLRSRLAAFAATAALVVAAAPAAPAQSTDPLAGFGRQTLTWAPCGTFQCATLTVPQDYLNPTGPVFHLPVIKAPAGDPAHRAGTLLVNPGGPAISGVEFLRNYLPYALSPTLTADFDVVAWDTRGVAGSDPALHCQDDAGLDAYYGLDPAATDAATLVRAGRTYAAACRANSAPGLTSRMGSIAGAFDTDVLRSALGEAKINYFGTSYGTFPAAWYAQLFPTHLRALVLDGMFSPAVTGQQAVTAQAAAAEKEVQYYESVKGNRALIDSLAAKLRTTPLPVPGSTRTVGPEGLAAALAVAVEDPANTWPIVDQALAQAAAGDGTGLLGFQDGWSGRHPDGTHVPRIYQGQGIWCTDHVWPTTQTGYAAMRSAAEAASPHVGALLAESGLPCTGWNPPTAFPLPLTAAGSPPILVVSTTGDPSTPYQWGVDAARTFEHGVLLTFQDHGHTAYERGNDCIDTDIDDYLVTGTPPASGTVC
ncbi:MAG: alpha/beta fold hydrolase [Catenulispora sp.]|nr:alpha/beta fold hydrolase [Catenulispora sp.]